MEHAAAEDRGQRHVDLSMQSAAAPGELARQPRQGGGEQQQPPAMSTVSGPEGVRRERGNTTMDLSLGEVCMRDLTIGPGDRGKVDG